jgi:hypothetical protein
MEKADVDPEEVKETTAGEEGEAEVLKRLSQPEQTD